MDKQTELENYLIKALDFPQEIHMESSSRCNSRCLTCPRDEITRPLGEMGKNLFERAVEETEGHNLEYIHLHLNGEPLYLPIDDLVERIDYAKTFNPTTKIVMFTNGSMLDEHRANKLLQSQLDTLVISVDGGNKEDYEKIRRGLSWDTLLKNVKYLMERKAELRSKLYVMSAIVPQKANETSVSTYFKIFSSLVDHCAGSGVNNIGGLIDADSMKLSTQRDDKKAIALPCWRIFLDLSIMSDGRACVCCQDVTGALPVGDFKVQTLKEIWQGKELTQIREDFIYGRKDKIHFCSKCDYMAGFVYPDFWDLSLEEWQKAYENVKSRQSRTI